LKNEYEVREEITAIFLKTKDGKTIETLIDTEYLPKLQNIKFRAYYEKNNGEYYAIASVKTDKAKSGWTTLQLHRLIMDTPKNLTVDHINHDTLDNRKSNLRNITHAQNCQNKKGAQGNSKSGIRGVHKHSKNNRWVAQLGAPGKKIYLGSFVSKEEAEKAVIEARKELMPYATS
jgi:hypothetical protein